MDPTTLIVQLAIQAFNAAVVAIQASQKSEAEKAVLLDQLEHGLDLRVRQVAELKPVAFPAPSAP